MKKIIIVLAIILISSSAFSQKGIKHAPYSVFIEDESHETFLISKKPITNREYIIYLAWLHHVYVDYPEVFDFSLPNVDSITWRKIYIDYKNDDYYNYWKHYLNHAPEYIRKYMFNPKYLDYPVLGIDWRQASMFCQWMTDRYNEYSLIKNKYLKENINQINEDCFVSEPYLVTHYIGLKRKKDIPSALWNDRVMLPSFRLPTSNELNLAKNTVLISEEIKPYKRSNKNFLKFWEDFLLTYSDSEIVFKDYDWDLKFKTDPANNVFDFSKLIYNEYTLDSKIAPKPKGIIDIFEQNGQKQVKYQRNIFNQDFLGITAVTYKNNDTIYEYLWEKDSLGMLPFIIIDEDENGVPILVEHYKKFPPMPHDPKKLYIFRYACSIRPKQFKY